LLQHEVLSILTTGKLNGYTFNRQLKANLFNKETREQYLKDVSEVVGFARTI